MTASANKIRTHSMIEEFVDFITHLNNKFGNSYMKMLS